MEQQIAALLEKQLALARSDDAKIDRLAKRKDYASAALVRAKKDVRTIFIGQLKEILKSNEAA